MATPTVATATSVGTGLAEVERLRLLLERQPSCLMRVARDGTLLAVNAAALGLLGAPDLAAVLGTSLLTRLSGDPIAWNDFLERVAAGAASLECELTEGTGTRAVVMQAIVIERHPDGVESVLVAARDVSTARRLEISLREQEELRQQLLQRVDRLTRERDELARALAQVRAIVSQGMSQDASKEESKGEKP